MMFFPTLPKSLRHAQKKIIEGHSPNLPLVASEIRIDFWIFFPLQRFGNMVFLEWLTAAQSEVCLVKGMKRNHPSRDLGGYSLIRMIMSSTRPEGFGILTAERIFF